MSPLANAPSRAAPKSPSVLRRCAAAAALIAAGAIAAQYLAGYFFLWVSHVDPRRATPLTILQYCHYYGACACHPSPRRWCAPGRALGL